MWPFSRKRSLRFAVFTRIAVHKPCMIRAKIFESRAHRSSYPFEKKLQTVCTDQASVRKNCLPYTRIKLSVRKKLPAVRTGQVIHSKKIAFRAHRSSYPFTKELSSATGLGYPCENNSSSVHFEWLVNDLVNDLCEWSRFICHVHFSAIFITLNCDTHSHSRLTLIHFPQKCSHKILSAFCL